MHISSLSKNPAKNVVALGTGVVVVALAIWYFLLRSSEERASVVAETVSPNQSESGVSSSSEVVFPVEVAIAHRGDLVKRLSTTGIVRANREVDVVARTAGEVVVVRAQNGEYVHEGDLLVELDDREYRLAYEKAASALLAAQIEYRTLSMSPFVETPDSLALKRHIEEAQRKLDDATERYKKGELSEDDFVRVKRDLETDLAVYRARRSDVVASKSGLSQAQEAFGRAKMDLESTEIRAPFSGYVANCELSVGMRVQPQKVLLKLVDVSRLLVDVEVLENEIGKIVVGRRAEVGVNAYPNERFIGRVVYINPIVDPESKTVKVTIKLRATRQTISCPPPSISLPPSPILRPGMFSTVRLETDILPNRLLVPKNALLMRDQRALVFVAQGGLAKWHYVHVGEENEQYLEIKSGIAEGDSVIVAGHYTLAHDARIRVERTRH